MKTTIFELLGMIKDGKAPKVIIYKNKRYWYSCKDKDYYLDADYDEALFDEYVITDILNNEVEILETTITYNQDNKIRKLDENSNIFNKGFIDKFTENELILINKINEIIDRVNTLC